MSLDRIYNIYLFNNFIMNGNSYFYLKPLKYFIIQDKVRYGAKEKYIFESLLLLFCIKVRYKK